jgi:hypothetical protein
MEIQFKRPELSDKNEIQSYLHMQDSRSCEYTFANVYLWARFYKVEFAVIHEMVVFMAKNEGEKASFAFPMGKQENLKTVLDLLMEWCEEQQISFQMHSITREQFEEIDCLYPGRFSITYDRDQADYVYEREKLAVLSGKKYHGKKNHVNKFQRLYPDWTYEKINDDNAEECFQMALKWRHLNEVDLNEEKNAEMCVTMNSLRLHRELGLAGGLLRVNGQVVAFSLGEPIGKDTFVVHIEKAFPDIEGAYTMINQQFVLHETEGYTYINREEDTGDEGLRQAKLSYRPIFMVEKGTVTRREETI